MGRLGKRSARQKPMLPLRLNKQDGMPLSCLLLGAHCDDIEIGVGGTVLSLVERYPEAHFRWVVFASDARRAIEAESSARAFLGNVPDARIEINAFRESYFPYIGAEIKEYFEKIKKDFAPDIIFTHCRNDRHQDHRIISDLTWNTFRDHFVLEYEIPKYDGDLGQPNFFSPLSTRQLQRKIDLLVTHFSSQSHRPWFDSKTFSSVSRLRGVECNAPEGYAEAFFCRKAIL